MYLDLVMLLNFIVDMFLILGSNRLTGFPTEYKRAIAASSLGAVYSGICLVKGFRFLGSILWRIVFLVLMTIIAFGWNKSTVRRSCIFLILCFALGGAASYIGSGQVTDIFMAGAVMLLLCGISFGNGIGSQEYLPVEIEYGDQKIRLIALRDSGNTLRDPVSGERVLVIGNHEAVKLTGLTREELSDPIKTMSSNRHTGFRLIPFHSVGCEGGMLLAKRYDNVRLNGVKKSTIVAFSSESLGNDGLFQALAGGYSS